MRWVWVILQSFWSKCKVSTVKAISAFNVAIRHLFIHWIFNLSQFLLFGFELLSLFELCLEWFNLLLIEVWLIFLIFCLNHTRVELIELGTLSLDFIRYQTSILISVWLNFTHWCCLSFFIFLFFLEDGWFLNQKYIEHG